ncbi:hypothetical protein L1D13_24135 [Vibrio tubiashii]|uniref:hypothetical protein n=1 Tax=Vibrio tubiashii TaxID=29498 RepID=UPI001EFCCBA8|nr:hypothetical protein [Vibrio tubiashii]MCG9580885.1 hypothetical protein [Vibrio tubiashii]MCG9614476.1 hypothetical protein [Vibrio tubiashii]MCG9689992.1 hypothetical protein [Vibrio tubiashii]
MIYEWLVEAFSTASGKAQFFSIVTSSCIAITVLLLNQWLTNRRERKKVYVEKIEELYLASIEYLEACDGLITDIQKSTYRDPESGYHRYNESTYDKREASIIQIEMLCGLYFPKVNFNSDDYCIKKMPIFWAATSGQLARREVDGDDVLAQSRKHIEESSKQLKDMCRNLMQSKMI